MLLLSVRGEKEKSNDNSFAIITTTAHWESLHSKFIVNSFSSNSSTSISWKQSRSLEDMSPEDVNGLRMAFEVICNSHALFYTPFSYSVLQQTYISCYLRCNFMFSRLLRILMFMFSSFLAFFLSFLRCSNSRVWLWRKE